MFNILLQKCKNEKHTIMYELGNLLTTHVYFEFSVFLHSLLCFESVKNLYVTMNAVSTSRYSGSLAADI